MNYWVARQYLPRMRRKRSVTGDFCTIAKVRQCDFSSKHIVCIPLLRECNTYGTRALKQ